jgi:hypothetical protein
MGSDNSFRQSIFLHEQQAKSRKEELGVGATMEGEFSIMLEHFCGVYLESNTKESGCQALRVNSCVSCTITTSVCCCLLVVFLVMSSLEFRAKRFIVTYARETLINEWDA